jgi:hypothetical protein
MPRFAVSVPLHVTVLRSGVPLAISGWTLDVGEGGLAADMADTLHAGEPVAVELRVPQTQVPLHARARVCYQHPARAGLQFLGLTPEQRGTIRFWAERTGMRRTLAEVVDADVKSLDARVAADVEERGLQPQDGLKIADGRSGRGWMRWVIGAGIGLVLVATAGLQWWKWDRDWKELETRVPQEAQSTRPGAQVPAETMQRLLVHKVDPITPPDSSAKGVVVLDTVIGSDGVVVRMEPISGAPVLAEAAMDAVRWWRFEPYQVDGRAVAVETMLAIEFE